MTKQEFEQMLEVYMLLVVYPEILEAIIEVAQLVQEVKRLREALRTCGEAWTDFGYNVIVGPDDERIEDFVGKVLS